MEKISTKLDLAVNDFRQAILKAEQEPRQYNKQSANIYKPEQSRFKLVVWFNDGNRRTYYSYDNVYNNKDVHVDEHEAICKLLRLVHKYAGTFKNAQIYATLDPDRNKESNYNYLVYWAKWNGQVEKNSAAHFKTEGKNCFLILNRLEVYSEKKFVK
jgi:hypothetical protein